MLSRLSSCAAAANQAIARYRYHEVAQLLWQFFWHEFCDWYLEIKKLRFQENSGPTADWRNVLYVFERSLRLLHPLMPFLTEELWQRLDAGGPAYVALARYPDADPALADEAAEREMELVQDIIAAARNLRAEMKADPRQALEAVLCSQNFGLEVARRNAEIIQKLANVKLELSSGPAPRGQGATRSAAEFELTLRLPLAQADSQRRRLEKQIEQLETVIANSRRQLQDEQFLGRAPARVVDSIRSKLADYETQLERSRAALGALPRA
jgi:valyl-tRNA synthetase